MKKRRPDVSRRRFFLFLPTFALRQKFWSLHSKNELIETISIQIKFNVV